jgi:hypothetical protein
MKYIFLLLLIANKVIAQDYSFKRVAYDSQIIKTNGVISVSDTVISIKNDNQPIARYPVQVLLKKDDFVQYKVLLDEEMVMNIFIQPNQLNNKIEKYSMVISMSNKLNEYKSKIIYFLIPK